MSVVEVNEKFKGQIYHPSYNWQVLELVDRL
jgi:hypothetical protein